MELVLTQGPDAAAELVAAEILAFLKQKPDLVLGLATGSTPLEVYRRLASAYHRGEADFSRVRTFNLDEYLDLPAAHPQSYRYFMRKHLFDLINLEPANVHFPPSEGERLLERCRAYEAAIREAGGIDIQLLGIGSNGHIGFNEPTSSLQSRTRIKTLTEKTLKDNSRFYKEGETQPELASTMGIGTILESKRILLQAFGEKKAEAIRAAVEGPVTSFCPGSALQLHPRAGFYVDAAAASLLQLQNYYRETRDHELKLQREGRL
jgi:glucosamine-6-phosphate deaminase